MDAVRRLRAAGAPLSMRKVCERGEIFRCSMICSSAVASRRGPHHDRRTAVRERGVDFPTLQRIIDACEGIAEGELGLNVYPNQIEVITAEQMLDAYCSVGMPLFYKHWSFGKHFAYSRLPTARA